MAKNKEQLVAEAKALDATFEPGEMTNAEIEAEIKKMAQPKAKTYTIAPGKALTVPHKGVLAEGQEIKAKWLKGGEEQLKNLIAKGLVK